MLDTWKAKSVFLVHDNTAIMKNLVTLAGSAVTDAGGKVLGLTAVTPHTTEFGVTVANIMAAKPDAVFLALYYSEGALVAKQLLAAGYAGHILSSDAGVDPGFMKLAGEDVAEKVVFITQPVTAQLPAAKAFIAAYMAKYHEAPGALSAYTYDAMKVALAVLNQTHSTDPKKLLPALKAYKAEGISGPIQFDSHGQVMAADFVALVVKNGEFVEP
jgi:branched-chain amino acid transport system substrate-binding protein